MNGLILVPLDGSEVAERALPFAEALARAGDDRILLVRAVLVRDGPGIDEAGEQAAAVVEAERYLARRARALAARDVRVGTRRESARPPRRSIGSGRNAAPR